MNFRTGLRSYRASSPPSITASTESPRRGFVRWMFLRPFSLGALPYKV